MPLRYMDSERQYSLYTWVEVPIEKNSTDPRPETYRAIPEQLRILEQVGTENNWALRREALFRKPDWQFASLSEFDERVRAKECSIGVISPGGISAIVLEDRPVGDRREYEHKMAEVQRQSDLFLPEYKTLTFLDKRIRLHWYCLDMACGCSASQPHDNFVSDWGLLELARRNGWESARAKLSEVTDLNSHELRLFVGNFRQRPWQYSIVGLWYPKLPVFEQIEQPDLFD